ncbi:MAG: hypothetical protein Q8S05_10310 [Sulfuricella sp.]|nr:hypothetical protein [Sulfuricella sp.]
MNVQQFIKKWHKSTLKERSASQSHFNDLCALLGEPTPTDVDPDGTWYLRARRQTPEMADEEILRRLLELNLARSK